MANLTFLYAALMFILGLIGFLTNPSKAHSALIVGISAALVFTVLGFYVQKGKKIALTWIMILGGLLSMMLVWRANSAWLAYFRGSSDKLAAALLISAMLLITLVITGLGMVTRKLLHK